MRVLSLALLIIGLTPCVALGQRGDPLGQSGTPTSGSKGNPNGQVDRSAFPMAQSVIDHFIEATGGASAYDKLPGLSRQYSWVLGEDVGTLTVQSGRNGAFRSDWTMRETDWHDADASTGSKTWQEDPSGICHKAADAIALQLRMKNDPSALAEASSFVRAMTVSRDTEIGGVKVWRLILIPNAGRPWYLFFDQESGHLRRWEFSRPDGTGQSLMVTRDYDDWRPVGGIQVPHRISEESTAGSVKFDLEEAAARRMPSSAFALTPCAKQAFDPDQGSRTADRSKEREQPASNHHKKLIDMIGPNMTTADGRTVPTSALKNVPNVLLYFTAKWCGPCRRFTPKLVDFAKTHANHADKFEIVLVSSDRAEDQMLEYMKSYKMSFGAVPYARRDTSGIKRAWGGRGIPNLVWLNNADELVQGSYVNGKYVGPDKVLSAFQKHLQQ